MLLRISTLTMLLAAAALQNSSAAQLAPAPQASLAPSQAPSAVQGPPAPTPAAPTDTALTAAAPPLPPLPVTLDHTTRLLVVAPHPDDETLAAGGLIQRVRANGGAVRVLLMTSGDGFPEGVERAGGITHPHAPDYRSYGQTRERETMAAMGLLG